MKNQSSFSHLVQYASELVQDVRFGVRTLARAPSFTLAAVACLAIGIGATSLIFSNLHSTVFRRLPAVSNPDELVRLQSPAPYDDYEEFRDKSGQFASLAAFMGTVPFVVSAPGEEPDRIWGHLATPNYFEVLGVQPARGRLFGPEEAMAGTGQVAVISTRLWRTRFGRNPAVIGRPIRVNGQPVTVIGVAPEDFTGASPTLAAADIWIPATAPAALAPELTHLHDRRIAAFDLIGRLKPGVTYAQAEEVLDAFTRRLERIHNDPGKDRQERRVRMLPGGKLFPIRDEDLPAALGFPVLLAGLVLLMSCGNVANMLIVRGTARSREIGVRLAVGAGRGRLVRQLLTESMLLSGLGCAAGLLLAHWAASFYASLAPMFPGYVNFVWSLDWQATLFAALAGVAAGVISGLAPALQATRADLVSALKAAGPSRLRARRWFSLRNVVVFHQVAASMVLLLLTGFIVFGYGRASSTDLGFTTRNLYLMNVDPVRDGYGPERIVEYFDRLPQRLERIPGVTAVSIAQTLPLAFATGESVLSAKVNVLGGPKSLGAIRSDRVGAGFFETMGIAILRGRAFTRRDMTDEANAIVVNETMARQVWPGQDPVGRQIEFEGKSHEVVGVARDLRSALPLGAPTPAVYLPAAPSHFSTPSRQGVTVIARVRPGFDAALPLRREMTALGPGLTVFNVRRIEDVIDQALFLVGMITWIYGSAGVFALLLASVGLAGVTSYSVARRNHEIGVRIALGAKSSDVLRLILKETAVIIACGAVVGFALAAAAMRALSSIMYAMEEGTRTSRSDPVLLIGAPAILAVLVLLACYFPARKATRIDPAVALKAE